MTSMQLNLARDPFGKLVLTLPDGERHVGVTAVRSFPVHAPEEGISLVATDGREVAWIEHLSNLDSAVRALVEQDLEGSQFMPEITAINRVASFAPPCAWEVDTDRGPTRFVLRGEEDIRRIGPNMLLIADTHGIHYLVRDVAGLNKVSRKILDRFL